MMEKILQFQPKVLLHFSKIKFWAPINKFSKCNLENATLEMVVIIINPLSDFLRQNERMFCPITVPSPGKGNFSLHLIPISSFDI
jgi:hypothetical protein